VDKNYKIEMNEIEHKSEEKDVSTWFAMNEERSERFGNRKGDEHIDVVPLSKGPPRLA
jgi:hypothetical protein